MLALIEITMELVWRRKLCDAYVDVMKTKYYCTNIAC